MVCREIVRGGGRYLGKGLSGRGGGSIFPHTLFKEVFGELALMMCDC